jgi:hypothetical protein
MVPCPAPSPFEDNDMPQTVYLVMEATGYKEQVVGVFMDRGMANRAAEKLAEFHWMTPKLHRTAGYLCHYYPPTVSNPESVTGVYVDERDEGMFG